jgi:hypothetical protein
VSPATDQPLTLDRALNAERGADCGVAGEPVTRPAVGLPWGEEAKGGSVGPALNLHRHTMPHDGPQGESTGDGGE